MAENKKSFVLYADQESIFKQLPDDIAGKLIKMVFEYVNDKNPKTDDLLLQVAFEPIKLQLKRDLKSWESKKKQKSAAGKLGGERSAEARRSKVKQNEATVDSASKNEANQAVNVTVNVNDTVINRQQVVEFLRGAAPISIPMSVIGEEADKLMNEYKGRKIGNLRALCNKWMNNYQEQQIMPMPEKKMVL